MTVVHTALEVDGDIAGMPLRAEILHWCREAARRGLMIGTQGNISVRLPARGGRPESVVITPSTVRYDLMQPEDLVVVAMDGTMLAGELLPSTELPVHLAHYARRPDVHAIVHTESTYVNVLAALGRPIEPVLLTMLRYARGTVPVMACERPTTSDFGARSAELMGDGVDAVAWANHGLLAVGPSLQRAYTVAAVVEENARVLHEALLLGEPHVLGAEMLDAPAAG